MLPFPSPSLPVLLSSALFASGKEVLLLLGCLRYLLSSAPSSASTQHEQKQPPPPSHTPTAHSWSFQPLKKKEKRPVWTWHLQWGGKTRDGLKRWRPEWEQFCSQLQKDESPPARDRALPCRARVGHCSGWSDQCSCPQPQRAQTDTVPPGDIRELAMDCPTGLAVNPMKKIKLMKRVLFRELQELREKKSVSKWLYNLLE